MKQVTEVDWSRLFAYDLAKPKVETTKQCRCGNKNCQTAKRIRCTCGCHSVNHGIANREGMQPLDKVLFEKEAVAPKLIPWFDIC